MAHGVVGGVVDGAGGPPTHKVLSKGNKRTSNFMSLPFVSIPRRAAGCSLSIPASPPSRSSSLLHHSVLTRYSWFFPLLIFGLVLLLFSLLFSSVQMMDRTEFPSVEMEMSDAWEWQEYAGSFSGGSKTPPDALRDCCFRRPRFRRRQGTRREWKMEEFACKDAEHAPEKADDTPRGKRSPGKITSRVMELLHTRIAKLLTLICPKMRRNEGWNVIL